MALLDFKNWTVATADGQTAVMKHKDGHTMHIAMKALPRIQQEQMKRLCMARGGEVEEDNGPTEDQPTQILGSGAADSGPVTPEGISKGFKKATGFANGGAADASDSILADASDRTPASHDTHITINAAPAAAAPAAPPQAPVTPSSSDAALAQGQAPIAPDQSLNAPAAVNLGATGIRQEADVAAKQAQATVPAIEASIEAQTNIKQQQQDNFNELKRHTDEFNDYIQSNPIDPRAYQESQSDDQKRQTAIGLFLGGLGGGGQKNVALDFLNSQIDRDVAAQQKNAENRKTIWGAYHDLYGDSVVATNLAKVSANDILSQQIQLAAAKLGTPAALARANQQVSTLGTVCCPGKE
jgi:hypothetical protein